jgi:DNA-binding IscR family transcriptional regulator
MTYAAAPMTSEQLAQTMQTNPVVVRRVLAGLREAGLVASAKGHGGGWTVACDLATTTLRDIYDAIGAPYPFALANKTEAPGCLVERAVNAALDDAMRDAQALLLERFSAITLGELVQQFNAGMKHHHGS